MSKLTRVIQRVFGETGGAGEFGKFGSNAASPPGTTTKDLTLIQSLSQYLDGWYSATANAAEPPRIQDRNALDFLFSSQLTYLMQNGIPEWLNDADQRYYADVSIVQVSGDIYIAIQGDDLSNINAQKNPVTETAWWSLLLSKSGSWPVGSTYIQFPGDSDPSTLGLPGTWSNVSSELAGDFIRFEGGQASAFNSGQQLDQGQGHWHEQWIRSTLSASGAVVFSISNGIASAANTHLTGDNFTRDAISDTVNGTPRIGLETRAVNRTTRKWRRTA